MSEDRTDISLEHFGVKGMKWGVRRSSVKSEGRRAAKTERKVKKADAKWQKAVSKDQHKIYNDAAKKFNSQIDGINEKYSDVDLNKNPNSKRSKQYLNEVNLTISKSYQEAIRDYPKSTSPSGRIQIVADAERGLLGFIEKDN